MLSSMGELERHMDWFEDWKRMHNAMKTTATPRKNNRAKVKFESGWGLKERARVCVCTRVVISVSYKLYSLFFLCNTLFYSFASTFFALLTFWLLSVGRFYWYFSCIYFARGFFRISVYPVLSKFISGNSSSHVPFCFYYIPHCL